MNAQLDLTKTDLVSAKISDMELEKEFANMERYNAINKNGNTTLEIDPRDIHICRWEGCMIQFQELEELSAHANDVHILSKDSNNDFACQWEKCSRKGASQSNKFSLLSHMRTHTGEKSFYCVIPECLKAFARADALLKHLKSVHNIDATSLHEAYEIINNELNASVQIFEKQNEYSVDIKDGGKNAAIFFDKRIHNELNMSHDELITSYMNMRYSSRMKLNNKILDTYRVKKIEFSPGRIEAITNKISKAIESYCNKVESIEKENKIATIGGLNNIDDLSAEELEKLHNTQKEYYEKLVKLRRLLDEQLTKYTNQSRYFWLKKQALLNQMLVSED